MSWAEFVTHIKETEGRGVMLKGSGKNTEQACDDKINLGSMLTHPEDLLQIRCSTFQAKLVIPLMVPVTNKETQRLDKHVQKALK